ncbi:MAG: hypothetical protein HRU35_03735 [Rickettsiaceae bacterium]|nr:hypothetical protein [Rickettsiaceae bacterium]
MINKNAKTNKKKHHQNNTSYKAQEKLGILISMTDFNNEVELDKAMCLCAEKNVKVVELVEFNNDNILETTQQFMGLINIIARYKHQETPLLLVM